MSSTLRFLSAGLVLRFLVLFSVAATVTAEPDVEGGVAVRLTAPFDYQVCQRTPANEGNLAIAADLGSGPARAGTVEARLVGAATAHSWQKLVDLRPNQRTFRSELRAPAGGWYRLEIRLKVEDKILGEAAVEHVGVGEVFVIAGQSNSANHGAEKQSTRTELVAAFSGTNWALADDPQPGASGQGGSFMPPFGDAMAVRFKVPIGIVAAGIGATSVREWLPQGMRFPNPPTLTNRVVLLPSREWTSDGMLFRSLVERIKQLGPAGFRAVLWHQGESDANQQDPTRTLPGDLYRQYLERLIRESQREAGWEMPWFVAQASYHTPDDPGSLEIRAAQQALWNSSNALAGPDTDALRKDFRDADGQGVHFSGPGLRQHAALWVDKVAPWLDGQLAQANDATSRAKPRNAGPPSRIALPGVNLTIEGRPAFVFLPAERQRPNPQPWIFYAPTLPPYPDEAERWMHEQFLAAGVAVAGVDVGEAYGNPKSHAFFDALYRELTEHGGFAPKPCVLGRSRGGLWVSSWAIANPKRVAGLVGIYPVFDLATYPGLTNAAPAFDLSAGELAQRLDEFNPIARVIALAQARVPAFLIHGDIDTVVPLKENSQAFVRRYHEAEAGSLVTLVVLEGQGHNMFEGFFHSQALVDFTIRCARSGTRISPNQRPKL